MEYHKLGDTFYATFSTRNASNAATAPTGSVTFKVYKNGTVVATGTCTSLDTCLFEFSYAITTGNGFANGNRVAVTVSAVVDGVTYADVVIAAFEVGNALRAATMQDLSAAPSATANGEDALGFMYQDARNKKRQSSDTQTTYKDDGSTAAWTRTVDATTSATTIGEAT